jgi:hypothetical protein
VVPEGCTFAAPDRQQLTPGAVVVRGELRCEGGIAGKRLRVAGLETTITDVLVRIHHADGRLESHLMRPVDPEIELGAATTGGQRAFGYDRIQVVKGWLDAKGERHEKVYDVVWGGDREIDKATGKLPPVGNTVDVANATWTNTIGAGELIAVWTDPDFDAAQPAVYYARVLEIPTPRWTAYDAKRFGVTMSPEVPMITQERAYTSPIWYTP